jgi:hypothetical protein
VTDCRRWFVPLLLAAAGAAQDAPRAFDLDTAFAAALPPRTEANWTLIPWRHSLTDALAEAKKDQKPVYLFVNDGDVESGRC